LLTLQTVRDLARLQAPAEIIAGLFPAQQKAVLDPAPRRAFCTTRRAGKTTAVLSDMLAHGMSHVDHQMVYVALTRASAEQIAWPILRELDRRYGLELQFLHGKLRVKLPTGSTISCYGADRPGWSARLYGQKLAKAAIDEAAFFSVDLNELIEDVIDPALTDLDGTLTLTSTPGHRPVGVFYDIVEDAKPGWSVHRWTAFDNPYMAQKHGEKIDLRRSENPDTDTDPAFLRNFMGKWVAEDREMVYLYNRAKNYALEYKPPEAVQYVLGVDLGWHDPTALVVLAYSPNGPNVYMLEAFSQPEMLLDAVAAQVRMYQDHYPGLRIVGDASRRQAFEELRRRYALPIAASERVDKESWIEVLNSDLHASKVKILPDAEKLADEMIRLGWVYRPNGKRLEDPRLRNDICDAALMAYRFAYHYRYVRPEPEVKFGTKEYYAREAERIEQQLVEQLDAETGYGDTWT
jgi:hypothetical protein